MDTVNVVSGYHGFPRKRRAFDDGLSTCDAPRILPSQLRFEGFGEDNGTGGWEKGLFVMSDMCAVPRGSSGRLGDGSGRFELRLGVKLDCRLLNTRRTRGVRFSASFPSARNACADIFSTASKSSGAARFFPITVFSGMRSTSSLSGVRALKTGVLFRSGVLGFGNDDGPETMR